MEAAREKGSLPRLGGVESTGSHPKQRNGHLLCVVSEFTVFDTGGDNAVHSHSVNLT